jgi:F-type H+-transporting ATPase subunit b
MASDTLNATDPAAQEALPGEAPTVGDGAPSDNGAPADVEPVVVVVEESGAAVSTSSHNVATSSHDGGGAPVFPPFDTSTFGSQLLWLAITFGALYFLMSRVALPRIGEILEVRRDRIEGDLAEADRLRQKTDQAIEAYERDLAEARQKAHTIAAKTRDEIGAKLDAQRAEVEAGLGAKIAEAEARIQAGKKAAMANVAQIATETAQLLVSRLVGKVPAKTIKDAVASAVKGA